MLKISRQQVLDRWDTLTDNLKEALFSEHNANILWQICEAQHIPGEKISIIATIAGNVILGFIHSDDLSNEIRNELGLNPELASIISREIDKKIFFPLKSELEGNYRPPLGEEISRDVVDLRSKIETGEEPEPLPAEKIQPLTEAPQVVSLEELPASQEALTPAETPEKEPEKTSMIIEEEEAPVILHREERIKPVASDRKSLGGLFGFLKTKEQGMPIPKPVAAEIEMGELKKKPIEPQKTRTEESKIKIVNYGEFIKPTGISTQPAVEAAIEPQKIRGEEPKPEINAAIPPQNLPAEEPTPAPIKEEPPVFQPPKIEDIIKPEIEKEVLIEKKPEIPIQPPVSPEAEAPAFPPKTEEPKKEEEEGEMIDFSSLK